MISCSNFYGAAIIFLTVIGLVLFAYCKNKLLLTLNNNKRTKKEETIMGKTSLIIASVVETLFTVAANITSSLIIPLAKGHCLFNFQATPSPQN
jgi:hypothetical protein